MDTSSQSDVPQPPKQAAYAQSSNPVSRNTQEQRGQANDQPRKPDSGLMYASSGSGLSEGRQYGDAPQAIHRTADSQPSSDEKLQQLEQERRQKQEPEGSRGHIDIEYGVEQAPKEGDIAKAVHGQTGNTPRVQPGAHSGPVGSTPGYEQDTAAQMDRKRAEHDRILGEDGGKSPAYYGDDDVDTERRQLRSDKMRTNEEVDVKGAVKNATDNVVV